MKIAIAAETAPAKTMIPVIEKIKPETKITSLTYSRTAAELLANHSDKVVPVGESRRNTDKKRSSIKIASLVLKDTYKTYRVLKKADPDLLLSCGNAGDVRKGIIAAKKLKIPNIHIEQDIYNPIETIAYSNIITVPDNKARKKLKKLYNITNTINIRGYPQAEYVKQQELTDKQEIYRQYNTDDFYLLVLGGDAKAGDIPVIIRQVETLDKKIIVIPHRFNPQYIKQFIKSEKIEVTEGYVELLSYINASSGVIYIAGMGITIEAGVLETPAVKIRGFHTEHASNTLAEKIGIKVVSIDEIPQATDQMRRPHGKLLARNGAKASCRVVELIQNMNIFKQKQPGIRSLDKIWKQRKKYR